MYRVVVVVVVLCCDGHASPVPPFVRDFSFRLCLTTSNEGDILSKFFFVSFSSSVCYRRSE
jgi:hypothetical protein